MAGQIIPNINGVKHAEKDATVEEVVVAEVVLLVVVETVKRGKLIGQVLGCSNSKKTLKSVFWGLNMVCNKSIDRF